MASVLVALVCGALIASALSRQVGPLIGMIAAVVIAAELWVLWPRHRRAGGAGVKVTPAQQPELWAAVQRCAATLGQPAPDAVLLTLAPTTSLTQRLGWLGRPTTELRIGLPVLAALDCEELEPVLAETINGQNHNVALLVNLASRAQHPIRRVEMMRARFLIVSVARRTLEVVLAPISRVLADSTDALVERVLGDDGPVQLGRHWPLALVERTHEVVCQAQIAWDAYWEQEVVTRLREDEVPSVVAGFSRWFGREYVVPAASTLLSDLLALEDRLLARA
jgi:hypothetical protein